jgi:hypothetical protein
MAFTIRRLFARATGLTLVLVKNLAYILSARSVNIVTSRLTCDRDLISRRRFSSESLVEARSA